MHTIDEVYSAVSFGVSFLIVMMTIFTVIIIVSRGRK